MTMNLKQLNKGERNSLIGGQIMGMVHSMQEDAITEPGIDFAKLKIQLNRILDLIEETQNGLELVK